MGTKENNGRARQRRLLKRIVSILSLFILILLVWTLAFKSSSHTHHTHHRNNQPLQYDDDEQPPEELIPVMDMEEEAQPERYARPLKDHPHMHFVKPSKVDRVISGAVHLVDVNIPYGALKSGDGDDMYEGVMGVFCSLDWSLHKEDPSKVPMFRDLVSRSPDCEHKFTLDLHSIVTQTRKHDEQMILSAADDDEIITPKPLTPSGFVFHESRCGSTLVANALVASNPPSHRVYSESTPPINVLNACKHVGSSNCDENKQVHLFRDVIYMMSRSNDGRENKTFFKIQSAGTKSISVFRKAFPSIPWVFVYRDPVQVMMSHLDAGSGGWQQNGGVRGGGGVPKNANCLRSKKSPTEDMYDLVELLAGGGRNMKDLTLMEHCALHLASICESAILEQSKSYTGVMINYVNLISILITDVFPNHFKIPLKHIDEQRIKDISTKYSKARTNVKKEEWHEDSDKKDQKASQEIKDAANRFLESGYKWLESHKGRGRYVEDGEVDDGEEIEEKNDGDGEV